MNIARRTLMGGVAAGLGMAGMRPGWALAEVTLGARTVMTLSDGFLTLPGDFILGPMPEEAIGIVRRYGLDPGVLTPPCNVTLMRDGARTVLFDCGAGSAFQDSAGRLPEALAALGVDPVEITDVILTHGHPDHLWGVLDDFDDPLFPDARHVIGRAEWEYWTDPATVDSIGTERTAFAVGAARRLAALSDRMEMLADGQEVLPGVTAQLTPGHTPGHLSFLVSEGTEQLMILGDAVSNHHVGFERPDWRSGSDQDLELAAQTRVALLDRLAADRIRLIGFHLPEGGIGQAERAGAGYRFVPE